MARAEDCTADVPIQISLASAAAPVVVRIRFGTSLDDADRELILATLEQCNGVRVRAAEILGISLKTLYNRLGEYREAGTAPASGAEVAARETDRAEAQRS